MCKAKVTATSAQAWQLDLLLPAWLFDPFLAGARRQPHRRRVAGARRVARRCRHAIHAPVAGQGAGRIGFVDQALLHAAGRKGAGKSVWLDASTNRHTDGLLGLSDSLNCLSAGCAHGLQRRLCCRLVTLSTILGLASLSLALGVLR